MLGGPLEASGLTAASIEGLPAAQAREGEHLEFKRKPQASAPGSSSTGGAVQGWRAEQEWAKDVCQFANARGGVLIFGVRENQGLAVRTVATVVDVDGLEGRLRTALANYSQPVPKFDLLAVDDGSGLHYIVVVVPPSGQAPHAVTDGQGPGRSALRFPIREGARTRWMSEHEVAEQYRQRGAGRALLERSLDSAVTNGARQLGLASGLWLYVAVAPEAPLNADLDQSVVDEIRGWRDGYGFASPFGRALHVSSDGFPAPARVTFTGRTSPADESVEVTDPRDGYLELYVDGRAFAAKPVTSDTAADATPGQVGHLTLVDDTAIVLDAALSWAVHRTGGWGSASVQAGLLDGGNRQLPYTTPLTLHSAGGGTLRRLSNTRLVRDPVEAIVSVDLATSSTQQGRMAAVRDVAAPCSNTSDWPTRT